MCAINMTRRLCWSVSFLLLAAGAASAQTTWYVDDDNCPGSGSGTVSDPFCFIQDGIDAASDAHEVVVKPGSYNEAIDLLGKAITLRSTDGPEVTTVDATGLNASVVKCIGVEGPDTFLDGFTITGDTGTDDGSGYAVGGGMYKEYSGPTALCSRK